MPPPHPTICFVGPAIGRHAGNVTTQGEVLAGLFAADGHPVLVTSTQRNKLVRAADTMACLLRWRRSIDVAVISVFSGNAFMLADQQSRLTSSLHLPTVLWLHGGALPDVFDEKPDVARSLLGRAAHVVTPSAFLQRAAEQLVPDLDVTVIPNVLDLDAYELRLRTAVEPRMLWMRTFHPLYRPTMALDVLERVLRDRPDATLTMAGHDGGELGATKDLARERGLGGSIDFPGFLGPTEKVTQLAAHDIFLNTNAVDNTPVGPLEAAASGLPIVATAVGGVPDLLTDGSTALLVPDGDADAMAAAVLRLVAEPDLAASLSVAGRRLAERSAWPTVRDAWRALLDDVLSTPGV